MEAACAWRLCKLGFESAEADCGVRLRSGGVENVEAVAGVAWIIEAFEMRPLFGYRSTDWFFSNRLARGSHPWDEHGMLES